MAKKLVNFIFIVLMGVALVWALKIGLDKEEVADCIKWNKWSKEISIYHMSTSTAERCRQIGVKIDGPVYSDEQTNKIMPITKETFRAVVFAYNSLEEQTDSNPYQTASGQTTALGTIACPSRMAFGTKVMIDGKIYICNDRMSEKYRSGNYFDIWLPTKSEALRWGKRNLEVSIIK